MNKQHQIVKGYLDAVSKMDFDNLMKLCTPHAKIHSPHFGTLEISVHYQKLFASAKSVKMRLKDTFVGTENKDAVIGDYVSNWTMKDGQSTGELELLCLFALSPDGKIAEVKMYYNSPHAQEAFNLSHQPMRRTGT